MRAQLSVLLIGSLLLPAAVAPLSAQANYGDAVPASAGKKSAPRKARVAVIPAVFSQGVRSKFLRELEEKLGIRDPSVIESPGFTGHLVDALVNSRKFDVLERRALNDVVKELDLSETDYADVEVSVKVGRLLNADYIVIPEIRFILLVSETKDIPFIPQTNTQFEGMVGTRMRVVDVGTSRVVASNIGENSYRAKQPHKNIARVKQAITFMDRLFATVAKEEVSTIIDAVYPIRIIAIDGETVTLNRGRGTTLKGETFKIYRAGERLVDPDTNEDLGYSETAVAEVMVTKVRLKTATAKITKFENGQEIRKLDVGRRHQAEKKPAPKVHHRE